MLTLRERQERAVRRAARIAAKHMAIRSAALGQGAARQTVGVGMPLDGAPPPRIRTSGITASGSCLG